MQVKLLVGFGHIVVKVERAGCPVLSLSFARNGYVDDSGRESCLLDFGCPVMPVGVDTTDRATLRVVRDVLNGLDLG